MQLFLVRYLPYTRFDHPGHTDNLTENSERTCRCNLKKNVQKSYYIDDIMIFFFFNFIVDYKQEKTLVFHAIEHNQASKEWNAWKDKLDKKLSIAGA